MSGLSINLKDVVEVADEPAISPFAETHAVKGVRARNGDQTRGRRIHSFEAHRTCWELVRQGRWGAQSEYRRRHRVIILDLHR